MTHPFIELEEQDMVMDDPAPPATSVEPGHAPTIVPPVFSVPPFSHCPPTSIRGRHDRWPDAPELQACLSGSSASLYDIYSQITPFLDAISQRASRCISLQYRHGSIGTPLWYTRPWTPYRRRR